MDEITYTHKGWFGLCPVYAAPYSAGEAFEARYPFTDWIIELSAFLYGSYFQMSGKGFDEYRPLRITGKLKEPIIAECKE